MDQSKKTMRHFYCRDVLWETFEQMANDFDCSIDYLINEAMRYYARSKNYQSSAAQIQVPGGSGSHGPMTPQLMPAAPYGAIVGKQQQTSNPQIRRPPAAARQPAGAAISRHAAGHARRRGTRPRSHHHQQHRPDPDAVPHLRRQPLSDRQGPVHHRARLEELGPGDQGRQHLAQARGRDPAQRDLLHQGPGLDQRHRLQGHAHRQQAGGRGRRVPHLRLRAALHVSPRVSSAPATAPRPPRCPRAVLSGS